MVFAGCSGMPPTGAMSLGSEVGMPVTVLVRVVVLVAVSDDVVWTTMLDGTV